MNERVARPVGNKAGPRESETPEIALGDPSLRVAGEERPHAIQFINGPGCFAAEDLDRILISQVVASLDGVVYMGFDRILRLNRGVNPPLRGDGVAADRMDFRK